MEHCTRNVRLLSNSDTVGTESVMESNSSQLLPMEYSHTFLQMETVITLLFIPFLVTLYIINQSSSLDDKRRNTMLHLPFGIKLWQMVVRWSHFQCSLGFRAGMKIFQIFVAKCVLLVILKLPNHELLSMQSFFTWSTLVTYSLAYYKCFT